MSKTINNKNQNFLFSSNPKFVGKGRKLVFKYKNSLDIFIIGLSNLGNRLCEN
jgi:hypothetical protein